VSTAPLHSGSATLIGSLPHDDPAEAAAFALAGHLTLPTAPQLPHRGEWMLAQAADGIGGVSSRGDGTLEIHRRSFDPDGPIMTTFGPDHWGGLLAFIDLVEARARPVKVQLTGPVTLALALADAGVDPGPALDVAARAVEARASALMALLAARAPGTSVVAFLDEPGLTAWGHPRFRVPVEAVVEALAGALHALAPAMAGVHCCGDTDWGLPVAAGAAVLSLPLDAALNDAGRVLAHFLDDGGWVAWGVIPTTGPVGDDPDPLWRRLMAAWLELSGDGCDPLRLRTQCLVTPVCGLAGHGISQATRVVRLTAALSGRAHDQAATVHHLPDA